MNSITAKRASFGAKARVIDLLGREQIADAPTALSELLKNSVDALATHSQINYNSGKKFLSISDNGLGMRTQDLLGKWLVIATDAKRGAPEGNYYEFADPTTLKQARQYPPLGEKGIGRLAVAALGRGVLVWTRWGEGEDAQRTLLFVHWNLFQHPRLSLDDIVVPYIDLNDRTPTQDDVLELFGDLDDWMRERSHIWESEEEKSLQTEILEDLRHKFLDCLEEDLQFPPSAGTTFFVLGTTGETDGIFLDATAAAEEDRASEGEGIQLLLGFCDPFGVVSKRLDVDFQIDGKLPTAERDFWTEADFAAVDHEIEFEIDDQGFVKGMLRRFDEKINYEFQCPPLPKNSALPGPMKLHLGYVAGNFGDSRMSKAEHARYERRLSHFGALYVYRDGIRVLPYGRNEFDFLRFEDRRSKNAGRYFFSHRRMFGGLYITKEGNPRLRDKAGREGFIRNAAYRGFVNSLIAVFIDLALSIFGRESDRPDKADQRAKQKSAEEEQKARAKAATDEFAGKLTLWKRRLPILSKDARKSIEGTEKLLQNSLELTPTSRDADKVLAPCYAALEEARRRVTEAEAELGTEVPAIVTLKRNMSDSFEAYMSERAQWRQRATRDLARLSSLYEKLAARYQSEQERLLAIQNQIAQAKSQSLRVVDTAYREFQQVGQSVLQQQAHLWLEEHKRQLDAPILNALGEDAAAEVVSDLSGECAARLEGALTEMRRIAQEDQLPFWETLSEQLRHLDKSEAGDLALGALNREVETLRESELILSELAQFGLIVESLDHEFNVLFADLERALDGLKTRVKADPQGVALAIDARHVFDNLQSKLQVLSPLYRRKMGGVEDVAGAEIRNLIERLYPAQRRDNTEIQYQKSFTSLVLPQVNGAILMAATANLVANALYWVTQTSDERLIRFTSLDDGFVISDSGPGISPRDRDRIFEPFFGRRPYGRGLGLYIAKANLESTGMEIFLASEPQPQALSGANFIIRKRES